MKKTVILITFCLSVSFVKAGEYDDYSLCINLKSQYHNYCNWQKYKHPSDVRKEDFDESGRFWEVKGKYLSVTGEDDWDYVYMMPYSECVLHVRKEKGEIWAGGIHCFVAYYHRGAVLQIFFKDQYELMGTRIGLLTEKEDCPEEEIGNDIVAETAVSMKTTIIQNADDWLKVNKGNIDVLAKSMGNGVDKGIKWSGKTLFYNNAELHIYVPKENFTPQFKSEWIKKLSNYNSNINYEIVILENYIR